MAEEEDIKLKYIHEAAKRGNADQVQEWLDTHPADVDDRDRFSYFCFFMFEN
jgi:hypothetical protein